MPVEWASDPEAFVALDWSGLVEADPGGTVFQGPRYLKIYWEEFGSGQLEIGLVRNGSEPVAAAAFEIQGDVLTFLGGFDVTDYMGPVGLAEFREAAAKQLLSDLAARGGWRRADLRGLTEEAGWADALAAAARDGGLLRSVEDDEPAPFLALPGTWEEYMRTLHGKQRHEIRRRGRRLRTTFPSTGLRDATAQTVGADLDAFMELHRQSEGAKGRFMVPGVELFFRRLADAFLQEGTFRLTALEAEGRRLAMTVGFHDRDRFLLYNSAYDHGLASLSPGTVMLADLVRDAIDRGCGGFDFLKEDLRYKRRFGARPRRLIRLLLDRR